MEENNNIKMEEKMDNNARDLASKFLKVTDIADLFGIRPNAVYSKLARTKDFPRPMSIQGSRYLWLREEVEAWVDDKVLQHRRKHQRKPEPEPQPHAHQEQAPVRRKRGRPRKKTPEA